MLKKVGLTGIVVFLVWSALDFVIHVVILSDAYEATKDMWRPEVEMKMGLMYFVTLVTALTLVYVYSEMVSVKSMANALKYALVIGFGMAMSFAYGSYSVMEIPYTMALIWFLGSMVEYAAAGAIIGVMVKD